MNLRRVFAAFAVVAAASPLRAACPVPKFDAPPSYNAGPSPVAVAVANINGDSWPDLVVGNSDGNDDEGGVTVLLGEPNAKFGSPVRYERDASFYSIAVADFDKDGDDDVVAFDSASNHPELTVLVLRNDRGVLVRAAAFVLDDYYSRVVTGDFDGDGRPDFVVVDTSDSIALFHGHGDFTFTKTKVPAGAALNSAVVVKDFDGDGKSDVAVIRDNSSAVMLFFGASNGFRTPVTWSFTVPAGTYARFLAAGDFNGDRKPDLLVQFDLQAAGLILDAGSGPNATVALTPPLFDNNGLPPSAVADFDGNGTDDVALASPEGVRIVHADNGAFRDAAHSMIVGGGASDIAAADLDGDGDPDVVAVTWGGRVDVLINNSGHSRSPQYSVYPGAVADFNHDSRADVLNGRVAWLAKPDGTLVPAAIDPGQPAPTILEPYPSELRGAAVGDLNGDGNPDFVYLGIAPTYPYSLQRTIGLGMGNGTFRITVEILDQYFYESAPSLADIDGDGWLDLLAVAAPFESAGPRFPVIIARGNGDGSFGPVLERDFGSLFGEVRIGDFNGDHRPDLLIASIGGEGKVVLNDGSGYFASPVAATLNLGDGYGIGDLNGDGRDDVAAVSASYDSTVSLYLSRGDGTFLPVQTLSTVISGVGDVVIRDLNGDGNKDIFIIEDTSSSGRVGSAAFLAGDGKGHFAGSVSIPTTGLGQILLGDFNGDGIVDLEDSGFVRLGACTPLPERHHAVR